MQSLGMVRIGGNDLAIEGLGLGQAPGLVVDLGQGEPLGDAPGRSHRHAGRQAGGAWRAPSAWEARFFLIRHAALPPAPILGGVAQDIAAGEGG